MHIIFKICIYSSSELTVLKLIQKKVINVLCEGKKFTTHIKHQDLSHRCGRGGTWRQKWESRGEAMANYP